VARKLKRMLTAGAVSFVVLLPSSVYLALRFQNTSPDLQWKLVQGVELVAGAAVIVLLMLNARDGLALGREKAGS